MNTYCIETNLDDYFVVASSEAIALRGLELEYGEVVESVEFIDIDPDFDEAECAAWDRNGDDI